MTSKRLQQSIEKTGLNEVKISRRLLVLPYHISHMPHVKKACHTHARAGNNLIVGFLAKSHHFPNLKPRPGVRVVRVRVRMRACRRVHVECMHMFEKIALKSFACHGPLFLQYNCMALFVFAHMPTLFPIYNILRSLLCV